MSYKKELDELRHYIDTELTERTIKEFRSLCDEFILKTKKYINDELLMNKTVSLTITPFYDLTTNSLYTDTKVRRYIEIDPSKNISHYIFIKEIMKNNRINIYDELMIKHFGGIYITCNTIYMDEDKSSICYVLSLTKPLIHSRNRLVSMPFI